MFPVKVDTSHLMVSGSSSIPKFKYSNKNPQDIKLAALKDNSYNINIEQNISFSPISRRNVLTKGSAAAALLTSVNVNAEEGAISTPNSALTIPTIKLGNSSLEVSRTIQGYWQLAGGHGKYNIDEAVKNMEAHYKAGITTLDTADIYGPSEQIMGKFVQNTPGAIPCTKFCCFRYLDEIDKDEVRTRIKKVR